MDFKTYQRLANKTNITLEKYAVWYPMIALAGEVGEVANHIQKNMRSDGKIPIDKKLVASELGDCLWYLQRLATDLDISLDDIATSNIEKLKSRQQRGKLEGDGDER